MGRDHPALRLRVRRREVRRQGRGRNLPARGAQLVFPAQLAGVRRQARAAEPDVPHACHRGPPRLGDACLLRGDHRRADPQLEARRLREIRAFTADRGVRPLPADDAGLPDAGATRTGQVRVTIVGAGAIGGTVGACLARSGTQVELVDTDAAHVAAIAVKGLTIEGLDETFTVAVEALTPGQLTGPLGTVLLAVKAQHTAEAVKSVAPLLTPDSTVVSLQNGLCPRTIAAAIGAERTIGALVNFSADYLEPGLITYGGAGTVRIGGLDGQPSPRLDAA